MGGTNGASWAGGGLGVEESPFWGEIDCGFSGVGPNLFLGCCGVVDLIRPIVAHRFPPCHSHMYQHSVVGACRSGDTDDVISLSDGEGGAEITTHDDQQQLLSFYSQVQVSETVDPAHQFVCDSITCFWFTMKRAWIRKALSVRPEQAFVRLSEFSRSRSVLM